jgi:hypothetical protein
MKLIQNFVKILPKLRNEPHHFYAAPAPGKSFDPALASAAPAPTLLYSKATFKKKLKFKPMLKLSYSFDSVRFFLLKIKTEWVIKYYILCHFLSPSQVNTIVGAVVGGAASRYVSDSDQMMRLHAATVVVYLQRVGIESGKSVGTEWVENRKRTGNERV